MHRDFLIRGFKDHNVIILSQRPVDAHDFYPCFPVGLDILHVLGGDFSAPLFPELYESDEQQSSLHPLAGHF